MGFNLEAFREQQEREAWRAKWIREPGWHVVEIVAYRFDPPGSRKAVIFTVRDDQGREQTVRFRLRVMDLRNGYLSRFVACAMEWKRERSIGMELLVANATTFRNLIGRRIAVWVCRGLGDSYKIADWARPPSSSANDALETVCRSKEGHEGDSACGGQSCDVAGGLSHPALVSKPLSDWQLRPRRGAWPFMENLHRGCSSAGPGHLS